MNVNDGLALKYDETKIIIIISVSFFRMDLYILMHLSHTHAQAQPNKIHKLKLMLLINIISKANRCYSIQQKNRQTVNQNVNWSTKINSKIGYPIS